MKDHTFKVTGSYNMKNYEEYHRIINEMVIDVGYSIAIGDEGTFELEWSYGSLEEITGYTGNGFITTDGLKKIVYPEDSSILTAHLEKVLKGKPGAAEYRIIRKDGSICWLSDNIRPYSDQDGNVIRITGAIKDITERKSIDDAYKNLVDNSVQGLVVISGGRIVFANMAAYLITGYTIEELLNGGKDILQGLVFKEDSNIAEILGNGRLDIEDYSKSYELRINRRDGLVRWIEVYPTPIGYNGGIAVQYVFTDISERKTAEEKFRMKSKEHEMLLDNIDMQIWYIYEKKIVGTVNKARALFLGRDKESIENESIYDIFEWEYAHKEFKKICEVHDKRKPVNSEEWHIDSFGNNRLLKISRTPMLDKSGKIDYVICTAVDITEEKEQEESIKDLIVALRVSKKMTEDRAEEVYRLNERLRNSEARLTELNASKDKFFSIISHDLKSPLNGLMGLSKVLSTEFDSLSNEDIREFAESMHHSSENLYKLLENLLHWSRLQRGIIEMEPEKLDIKQLSIMNKELLDGLARQKNIEIRNDVPDETFAYADTNMINTVIRNLVSNAVKFTHPGGEIVIALDATDHKSICVSVSDDGVGMNEETMSKIFRIDKVVTSEGTAHEKGTGLGLILCKELVEKNGGNIWVDSAPGEGTTFYFTLPVG